MRSACRTSLMDGSQPRQRYFVCFELCLFEPDAGFARVSEPWFCVPLSRTDIDIEQCTVGSLFATYSMRFD